MKEHRKNARSGMSLPVYNALRRYRVANCKMRVLCIGSRDYIADLEVKAIAAFRACDDRYGYNVSLGGDISPMLSPKVQAKVRGRKQSPEWVQRSADARRGKRRSVESRAKMSAGQKKRIRTPEEIARMGEMSRNKVMTPEYRENIRQAALKRWARQRQQEAP